MPSRKYARGSRAWFICGRCGQRGLYSQSLFDGYYPNLRVHPECWEDKHPQDCLPAVKDPIALWRPSPESFEEPTALTLSGVIIGADGSLSWTASTSDDSQIVSYNLFRSLNASEDFELVNTNVVEYDDFGAIVDEASSLVFLDTGVDFTTNYYHYYVDAVFVNETTARSNTIPLATPPLAVVLDGDYVNPDIDLSWTASGSDSNTVAFYTLYRSVDGGTYVPIAVTLVDEPRVYLDTDVDRLHHDYAYKVIVTDAIGVVSADSNIVEFLNTVPTFVAGRNINGGTFNYLTSTDGINWTLRSNPLMSSVRGICFSPELGLLVAVGWNAGGPGPANVQTSPDGVTWTSRTAAGAFKWNDVCWSAARGLFAACATDGGVTAIMTSPDGITWTLRTTPNQTWNAIRYLPSAGLFACGGDAPAAFNPNAIMTSPDGITWTLRAVPMIGVFACRTARMDISDSRFLSTNRSEAQMMTSPDGINWTLTADNIGGQSNAAFGEGTVVVINPGSGGGTHYEYSLNGGTSLTLGPLMSATLAGGEAIAYSPEMGLFVSTGMSNINGKNANYSLDGINWTDGVTPMLAADNAWYCVCAAVLPIVEVELLDVLRLHCDGTNGSTTFIDESSFAHVMTCAGAAAVTTTNPKFGTGALGLPGGGSSWLSTPIDASLDLSATVFTVQFWFRPTAADIASSSPTYLMGCRNNINTSGFTIYYVGTSGQIAAQMFGGGASVTNIPPTLVAGQWYHLAYVYDGVQFQLYINGVGTGAAAVAGPFNTFNTPQMRFGADVFAGITQTWDGAIDDIHITKYAIYTSNFTPPAAPF